MNKGISLKKENCLPTVTAHWTDRLYVIHEVFALEVQRLYFDRLK